MRVIAGHARGRRLAAPRGLSTRPTPARVREALFSILAARVGGSRVLDLFAGTGALGIEALSRGAASAVFVESDGRAAAALRQNLDAVGGTSRLLAMSFERALSLLGREGARFELVLMDPPYAAGLLEQALLGVAPLVAAGGLVVAEHHKKAEAPAAPACLHFGETRRWGDTAMSFYEAEAAA